MSAGHARREMSRICFAVGLLFTGYEAPDASAEVFYGTIVGAVTDPTNAAIPKVKASVPSGAMGLSRQVIRDEAGYYSLPNLPQGSYDVSVSASGFRPFTRTGVGVLTNTVTRVDVTPEVGAVTESTTVAASTSLLQTTKTDLAQDKPRVFISSSDSWQVSGGFGATSDAAGGAIRGGASPQTAEIMRTFGQRCPEVIVTNVKEKADFAVILDHEGGKGLLRRDNKIVVFAKDGDMVFSRSTRSLGNAVKDACLAIVKAAKKAEPSK